jgi:hypothetical protein
MNTAERIRAADYREPTGIQMTSTEATDIARARLGLPTSAELAANEHVEDLTAEIAAAQVLDNFNRAHSNYLAARDLTPTLGERVRDGLDSVKLTFAVLWPRISHAAVALGLILLTVGGCLIWVMVAQ